MPKRDIDKALRAFEKEHPIKKQKEPKMGGFLSSIERQLDKLDRQEKRRKR